MLEGFGFFPETLERFPGEQVPLEPILQVSRKSQSHSRFITMNDVTANCVSN